MTKIPVWAIPWINAFRIWTGKLDANFSGVEHSYQNWLIISFQIEWNMIFVAGILLIMNRTEFRWAYKQEANRHNDHIPFNMKGIRNRYLWVSCRINRKLGEWRNSHCTGKTFLIIINLNLTRIVITFFRLLLIQTKIEL